MSESLMSALCGTWSFLAILSIIFSILQKCCCFMSYREKLLDFLHALKKPDGSFNMHVGGEVDVRSDIPCSSSHLYLAQVMWVSSQYSELSMVIHKKQNDSRILAY